jgi:hypothetical protein
MSDVLEYFFLLNGQAKKLTAERDAALARVAELEAQLARLAFVTDRLPPPDTYVEVLVPAQWEPGLVEDAAGRWRDMRWDTLYNVRGWRPLADKEA